VVISYVVFRLVNGVLMPLSTIFQLYRGVAVTFIGEGNRGNLEKTTDLPQVTDKLYQIIVKVIFLTILFFHNILFSITYRTLIPCELLCEL